MSRTAADYLAGGVVSRRVIDPLVRPRAFAWILIIEGVPHFWRKPSSHGTVAIVFLLAVCVNWRCCWCFASVHGPAARGDDPWRSLHRFSFCPWVDPDHFADYVIVKLTLGLTTAAGGEPDFRGLVGSGNIKPSALDQRDCPPFFLSFDGALLLISTLSLALFHVVCQTLKRFLRGKLSFCLSGLIFAKINAKFKTLPCKT